MEDRPPKFGQPENEFAAGWFARLEQAEPNELEDDDDSEAAPAKRWRRFWRRLFSKLPLPTPPAAVVEASSRPFERPPADAADKTAQPEAAESQETTASESPESHEQPVEVEPPAEVSNPPQTSPPEKFAESQPGSLPPAETVNWRPDQVASTPREGIVFERPLERPMQTPIVESRGAFAAAMGLVGLEYFGRKSADRRLKREVNRLHKRVQDGEQAAQQLQTLASKSNEQLQQVRHRQQAYEARLPVVPPEAVRPAPEVANTPEPRLDRRPAPQEQRENRPAPQEQLEKRPVPTLVESYSREDTLPATELMAESRRPAVPAAEARPEIAQPETVFNKVVDAAEHDQPIERIYERRHEVKDDAPTTSGAAGGPVSVGQIVAQKQAALAAAGSPPPALPAVKPPGERPLYQQAVQRGFWGGLVMLIFVLLIALLY